MPLPPHPLTKHISIGPQIAFVVTLPYPDWTTSNWLLLASFINSVASVVNVDAVRQEMVFEYVTNGAGAIPSHPPPLPVGRANIACLQLCDGVVPWSRWVVMAGGYEYGQRLLFIPNVLALANHVASSAFVCFVFLLVRWYVAGHSPATHKPQPALDFTTHTPCLLDRCFVPMVLLWMVNAFPLDWTE